MQGSTGIGLTLIAGPAVLAVEPLYAPGPFLIISLIISLRNSFGDGHHVDKQSLKRSYFGIPFGVLAGIAVLSLVPRREMALLVGLTVCVLTATLLLGWKPNRTPTTETATGAAVSFTAVSAGLPGPPLVIGYHDLTPAALRGMAGSLVTVVIVVGMVSLWLSGNFGLEEVKLSALAIPGMVVGLVAARYARPLFDRPGSRTVVLGLAFLGGLGLVIRQF